MNLQENSALEIANLLEAENARTNAGRGSTVCRAVIEELRRNDINGARLIAELDYDKVRQYPELAKLFKQANLVSSDR